MVDLLREALDHLGLAQVHVFDYLLVGAGVRMSVGVVVLALGVEGNLASGDDLSFVGLKAFARRFHVPKGIGFAIGGIFEERSLLCRLRPICELIPSRTLSVKRLILLLVRHESSLVSRFKVVQLCFFACKYSIWELVDVERVPVALGPGQRSLCIPELVQVGTAQLLRVVVLDGFVRLMVVAAETNVLLEIEQLLQVRRGVCLHLLYLGIGKLFWRLRFAARRVLHKRPVPCTRSDCWLELRWSVSAMGQSKDFVTLA